MTNAIIRKNVPPMKIDIIPNPSTKNPPIAIPRAIPPFKMLKKTPFASSGLSGMTLEGFKEIMDVLSSVGLSLRKK